jgi:amino acid permease
MPDESSFFGGLDILDGLPARRAGTILFAIQSRAAHQMAQSRQAAASYVPPKTAEAREQAFLHALAQGRDLPLQPAIQDLERYAPQWAALAPDNPGEQAAIAHLLAQEYTFTSQRVPALRQALGLDDEAVQAAYQSNYDQPLQTIFASSLPLKEQLRWRWASLAQRLENLPPFWTAYALTVTGTVGAGILALPIALAGVGPIAGVILLLVLGLVNILTITDNAEAITRNGNIRYGSSFMGRLVGDYLSKTGMFVLSAILLVKITFSLTAFYIGVATTLADATGGPAMLWAALLFIIVLYFLRRESLDATIASAFVIGAVNITLILIISFLTLPHIRLENLQYVNVPLLAGQPVDTSIFALIFGVVLAAYFGHTSAVNAAKVVLRRDPTGKALIWGNIAALATAMGLYILWVVAVNGSIAPDVLAATSGTVLTPLANVVGPVVIVLGTLFVILGMGMITIHFSLALFNQIREWLPDQLPTDESSLSLDPIQKIRSLLLSQSGRFWIGIFPIALIFGWVEWLIFTGQSSFIGPIALQGVITLPVLAGIFPILMLAASRRKGDYVPGLVWRFLDHPVVVVGIYLIFMASIILHGLFIWSDPLPRLAAVLVAGILLVVTVVIIRQGVFTTRTVVELRANQDRNEPSTFTITAVGKPLMVDVYLNYQAGEQHLRAATGEIPNFNTLRSIAVQLPPTPAKELKVWLHQLTSEDFSETLPARVSIIQGQKKQDFEMTSSGGQVVLPLEGQASLVEISLDMELVSDLLVNL